MTDISQLLPSEVLMVRPARFYFNDETSYDNAFQTKVTHDREVPEKAAKEFDNFVQKLRDAGIHVTVAQDTAEPSTPDSIFPNNIATYHANGTVILYPMKANIRRLELSKPFLSTIYNNFSVSTVLDISDKAKRGQFLEGTGSMIFDHVYQRIYACHSDRTDPDLLYNVAKLMHYTPILFNAVDANGIPIYHTNVMMAIADNFAVICLEAIRDSTERNHVVQELTSSNRNIVDISLRQVASFAGNVIQLTGSNGVHYLVMSQSALDAYTEQQLSIIRSNCEVIAAPLDTIETNGGGSARCMIAEVCLPLK
ncbi:MAG: amidinotransferase [Candidatus Saccharimonas sp.]|nr:amidinotransferase [Candidatus Saccharimonas sp.]